MASKVSLELKANNIKGSLPQCIDSRLNFASKQLNPSNQSEQDLTLSTRLDYKRTRRELTR
ncbi:hypothetical protein Bpfe_017188, partial [Biomphalaria pfeifferi]